MIFFNHNVSDFANTRHRQKKVILWASHLQCSSSLPQDYALIPTLFSWRSRDVVSSLECHSSHFLDFRTPNAHRVTN